MTTETMINYNDNKNNKARNTSNNINVIGGDGGGERELNIEVCTSSRVSSGVGVSGVGSERELNTESQVGSFGHQVGPLSLKLASFVPQVGPFEPQVSPSSYKLAPLSFRSASFFILAFIVFPSY